MATPIRILLVEDVPEDAELAEQELRGAGIDHVLLRVLTREALLDALATFSPDIVLSDYSLPGFDGMEALRITRERSPELPFVVLAGSLNEEAEASRR